MPLLDRLLGKNPYCPIKFATFENAAIYSFQRVMERVASQDAKSRQDFLGNFLEAKQQYPDIVSDNDVVRYLMMNVRRSISPSKACNPKSNNRTNIYRYLLVLIRLLLS